MRNAMEKAAQIIKELCKADDYVLSISSNKTHAVRFATNAITQHMTGSNQSLGLYVAFGKKTGSARTNQLDEESLKRLVKTAETIAINNQEDPEYVASEAAKECPEMQNYYQSVEDLAPQTMVDMVKKTIDAAVAKDAVASGMCDKYCVEYLIATKNGFMGFDRDSGFGHSMTYKKASAETKVSAKVMDMAKFNLDVQIAKICGQLDALENMQNMAPGKINVILRPDAVSDIMMYMYWMLNRRQADEGMSPFSGQLGKKIFGEKMSLYSTLTDGDLSRSGFNESGIPAEEVNWVEDGVLKNMPVDRYWAKEQGVEVKWINNIYMPGGTSSETEMMQMVDKGIIINRFWYIRSVDQKRGELTGMTRDGVLYFENGKVLHAVNNFRWNEIIHEFSKRIIAMGPSVVCNVWDKMPTLLIKDFEFVDATTF